MITFLRYTLLFFFYSAAGWVVESLYCSIGEKRLVNRGFMTGPMCPIYGTGAIVMTLFMYNPYKDRPLIVFLLGMVLCDIVEYLTSVIMEFLFHARWWDYTYEFLNIKGRICLKHTLFWGIASVSFVYIIHPGVDTLLLKMNEDTVIILTAAILIVFFVDIIHSIVKALDVINLLIKVNKAISVFSGGINTVKNTVQEKYQSIQDELDKGNEKINYTITDIYNQLVEFIEQCEKWFKLPDKNNPDNKYSSRFLRNGLNIEKYTRKQIEKLKLLAEEFKLEFFDEDI